jgi:hypothetical protein
MGRQDDILFCKIAVTNKLVTAQQASKCLAICDRREVEAGHRPMVGHVFSKYNLLKAQEVQRINAAVNKRLGRTAADGGVGVEPRRAGRGPAAPQERRAAAKIDPQTLWLGIGSGVIVLGGVIVLLVIFFSEPAKKAAGPKTASSASQSVATPSATDAGPAAAAASAKKPLGAPGAAKSPLRGAPKAPGPRVMTNTLREELNLLLNDAIRYGSEDNPQAGIDLIKQFLSRIQGYISPEYDATIQRTVSDLQARVRASGGAAGAEAPQAPAGEPGAGSKDEGVKDDGAKDEGTKAEG